MTDLIARATREVCGAGECEQTTLLRARAERAEAVQQLRTDLGGGA